MQKFEPVNTMLNIRINFLCFSSMNSELAKVGMCGLVGITHIYLAKCKSICMRSTVGKAKKKENLKIDSVPYSIYFRKFLYVR